MILDIYGIELLSYNSIRDIIKNRFKRHSNRETRILSKKYIFNKNSQPM